MEKKHILFVSQGGKSSLLRVVHRALVSSGSKVDLAETHADAQRQIDSTPYDLILLNYDEGGEDTRKFASTLLSRSEPPTVLLSQRKEKEHLISLFSHDRLRNLVARNDEVSESELIITTEKMLRQDIFGLDKYLTWGANIVIEPIKDSAEKTEQVRRVGEFVRSLQCDARFVRTAEMVTDELLMNALYDAPVDDAGKALYAHLPRTERVVLEDKDQGSLRYGSDGRYFAVSCRDRFGALKAQTVVNYLKKCFAHDEHQIDTKAGGAGVGFYMIFQALSQMIINIEPGKMTETLGLIDIRTSYRETKARTKSFNIFVKQV